ncbi:hypothetical protein E2C01_040119 [Portunus trituberculatus]|uniref:Uncharacterized protein n=1 Tax=Portunus trituberculatus TaxID=210409 RepID=A0A5B7FN40_PORTR|nr:hypothetical protein [Portunus trituberculatus]
MRLSEQRRGIQITYAWETNWRASAQLCVSPVPLPSPTNWKLVNKGIKIRFPSHDKVGHVEGSSRRGDRDAKPEAEWGLVWLARSDIQRPNWCALSTNRQSPPSQDEWAKCSVWPIKLTYETPSRHSGP